MVWESRCYLDGIPDEVPQLLQSSNRAPSYKAIAVAILRNDNNLISLGFSPGKSKLISGLKSGVKAKDAGQVELF